MVITTYVLLYDNPADNEHEKLSSVEKLLAASKIPTFIDKEDGDEEGQIDECPLYEEQFVFDMCEVSAIHRASYPGFVKIYHSSGEHVVKMEMEQAIRLFAHSRGENTVKNVGFVKPSQKSIPIKDHVRGANFLKPRGDT